MVWNFNKNLDFSDKTVMLKVQESENRQMSLSIHPFSLDPGSELIRDFIRVISDSEKHKAERYRRQENTRRCIAAHGNLRRVLSEYTGIAPGDLVFKRGEHGKPYLSPAQNPGKVSFNMTHSHELGIVAVCRENDIGVDVEYIKKTRPFLNLARRYFSEREVRYLETLEVSARRDAFYRIWTLKESWLKATGLGIMGLGLIGTAPAGDNCLAIVEWGENGCQLGSTGKPMDYRHFYPESGYVAAYTRLYSSQTVSTT